MAKIIRIIALIIALVAVAGWAATGAHRGWTKTSVAKMTVDEVTGIETPTYEKKLVIGVDILGAALLGSAALAGVSLFVRNKSK